MKFGHGIRPELCAASKEQLLKVSELLEYVDVSQSNTVSQVELFEILEFLECVDARQARTADLRRTDRGEDSLTLMGLRAPRPVGLASKAAFHEATSHLSPITSHFSLLA